jgi:uncharacterized membrane protein YdcZ (DUF606 family)
MATWTRGALGTVFVMSALWLWAELGTGKRQPARPRAWWM